LGEHVLRSVQTAAASSSHAFVAAGPLPPEPLDDEVLSEPLPPGPLPDDLPPPHPAAATARNGATSARAFKAPCMSEFSLE
jgi:hypothetical protein